LGKDRYRGRKKRRRKERLKRGDCAGIVCKVGGKKEKGSCGGGGEYKELY
jgi:hypothetical protein